MDKTDSEITCHLTQIASVLHDFKFKIEFLAAKDGAEIELPEFAREAKGRPVLVEIRDEFKTKQAPKICQAHICANRFELNVSVEGEGSAIGHEAGE